MNLKKTLMLLLSLQVFSFIKADLLDFYSLSEYRNLPIELQDIIVRKYLKKNPYNLGISKIRIIDKVQCETKIWGAAFHSEDQIITTCYHNSILWALDKDLTYRVLRNFGNEEFGNRSIICINFSRDGYYRSYTSIALERGTVLSLGNKYNLVVSSFNYEFIYIDNESNCYHKQHKLIDHRVTAVLARKESELVNQSYLATVSNNLNEVILWKKVNGKFKKLSTLEHPGTVFSASFNEKHDKVITSCDDGKVRIWDFFEKNILDYFIGTKAFSFEQLLFIRLIHDWHSSTKKEINLIELADQPAIKLNITDIDSLTYLNNILNSFDPELREYLVKKYNIQD